MRETLRPEDAEHLRCPTCGHDVQPEDTYREIAHSIGEVYFHPYCPECNVYLDARNLEETSWWVE